MISTFVTFPKTELKFYLFNDDVDEAMAKKLQKLGCPDPAIIWPTNNEDKFLDLGNGLYQQGMFQCDGLTILEATDSASYICTFNAEDNSVTIELEGKFFCGNSFDDDLNDPIKDVKFGYVWATRLRNDKNKHVKKRKDEWGMSDPIEALVVRGEYDNKAYRINFEISLEEYQGNY